MEMHQLRYVVAVARTRNFSRAAEQCHVSQPSLSQQIQKLEDELGERLFDRTKREAKLTPHGETFLLRGVRILEEVDAAKREATDAKSLLRGSVTVGVLPTIAPYLLPAAMAAFTAKFPGLEMVVQEDTTARLLRLALGGEIDFALASRPIREERLEVRELFSEELLIALPPGHPLTRKRTVRANDLEGERLIVMQEGHCLGMACISTSVFAARNWRRFNPWCKPGWEFRSFPRWPRTATASTRRSIDRCAHRNRAVRSLHSGRDNVRPDAPRASF
jgi:LysR family hydrogen peroxide-inducible transcriptional activator